jgi:hypothetical protein
VTQKIELHSLCQFHGNIPAEKSVFEVGERSVVGRFQVPGLQDDSNVPFAKRSFGPISKRGKRSTLDIGLKGVFLDVAGIGGPQIDRSGNGIRSVKRTGGPLRQLQRFHRRHIEKFQLIEPSETRR